MTTEPKHFGFGENWGHFLALVDEGRIREAERSLTEMLGRRRLDGMRFCDVGSGSGLFSLAARRLGATVHSFDYDPMSVACTAEMRRRFLPDDPSWTIEQGSVLEPAYLQGIGPFDIVYAWGVLHHTGAMWRAMHLVAGLVGPGGLLYIALYNDQGWRSHIWRGVKRAYNVLPASLHFVVVAPILLTLWGAIAVRDLIRGHPFASWRNYSSTRGMSPWHDLIDWVGGYPFEVARVPDVVTFFKRLGFSPRTISPTDGLGCNEFVFRRAPLSSPQ